MGLHPLLMVDVKVYTTVNENGFTNGECQSLHVVDENGFTLFDNGGYQSLNVTLR